MQDAQTTFFAAAEGQLLDISTPHGREPTRFPYVRTAANTILSGALIIHMSAGTVLLNLLCLCATNVSRS